MSTDSRQVGGKHYKGAGDDMQHWNIVIAHNLDYFQGQITKYVMRWRDKGGVADLEKAQHFLEKYIDAVRKGQIVNNQKMSIHDLINGANVPTSRYVNQG